MQNLTFIYILLDPREGYTTTCYIGKSNNPELRLREHIGGYKRLKTIKSNWVKSLNDQGLQPVLEILDEVPESEWQFWEQYYISLYKSWGFKLKNDPKCPGGEGFSSNCPFTRSTAEFGRIVRKEYAIMRGYWFSPEALESIREKAKERKQLCKVKPSKKKIGKKWTESQREKAIRYNEEPLVKLRQFYQPQEIHIGMKRTSETKEKIRKAAKLNEYGNYFTSSSIPWNKGLKGIPAIKPEDFSETMKKIRREKLGLQEWGYIVGKGILSVNVLLVLKNNFKETITLKEIKTVKSEHKRMRIEYLLSNGEQLFFKQIQGKYFVQRRD